MEEVTLYVKLKAKYIDIGDYITYVFENLNAKKYDDQYLMCVQFPNWNQSDIEINEIGYVNVRYVTEGISQWFDGEKMNVYKYTNIIFLKFVKEPNIVNNEVLID
jgi:hypothetical protein